MKVKILRRKDFEKYIEVKKKKELMKFIECLIEGKNLDKYILEIDL